MKADNEVEGLPYQDTMNVGLDDKTPVKSKKENPYPSTQRAIRYFRKEKSPTM